MGNIELTMREEQWILTEELFDGEGREDCPGLAALRTVDESQYDALRADLLETPCMRFYNPELSEYSGADSWLTLMREQGMEAFDEYWRLPEALGKEAQLFCRGLRNLARAETNGAISASLRVFYHPSDSDISYGKCSDSAMMVYHRDNCLAPYFAEKSEALELIASQSGVKLQLNHYGWGHFHLEEMQ